MLPPVSRPLSAPCLAALALLAARAAADTLHVDAGLTTGANDGSSWADAFQGSGGLQAALAAAQGGDRIFVREGTYLPTDTGNRNVSFDLASGVEVYGSFLGTETEPEERPPLDEAPSVLNADLAGDDDQGLFGDNGFHVLRAPGADATAVLDGFFVVGGNADGGGANQDRGGGILCVTNDSPTVRRCRFVGNRASFGGGAGYVNGSAPTFTDCSFEDGDGGAFGGAFDVANADDVVFERCTFTGNVAGRGGALEIFSSSDVRVANGLFAGNESTGSGAGGGGAMALGSRKP